MLSYVVEVVHHWGRCQVVLIHGFAVFTTNFVIFQSEMVPCQTSPWPLHVYVWYLRQPWQQLLGSWEMLFRFLCLLKVVSPPCDKMSHCCHMRCIPWHSLHSFKTYDATQPVFALRLINRNFTWSTKSLINCRSSINHERLQSGHTCTVCDLFSAVLTKKDTSWQIIAKGVGLVTDRSEMAQERQEKLKFPQFVYECAYKSDLLP